MKIRANGAAGVLSRKAGQRILLGQFQQGALFLLCRSDAGFVVLFPADVHAVQDGFQVTGVGVGDQAGGHTGPADAFVVVVGEQLLLQLAFAIPVGLLQRLAPEPLQELLPHGVVRDKGSNAFHQRIHLQQCFERLDVGGSAGHGQHLILGQVQVEHALRLRDGGQQRVQLRFKDLLCPGNGGDVGGVLNKGVLPFPLDALGFDAEDLAAVVDLGRVGNDTVLLHFCYYTIPAAKIREGPVKKWLENLAVPLQV